MDIEVVRDLIQLMVDNDLAELEVQDGETRVALKRRGEEVQAVDIPSARGGGSGGAAPEAAAADPSPTGPEPAETGQDEGLVTIRSPMVGTFYAAAEPEAPPYIQVGSEVEPDTLVCIIEAMKVYNEIKAETAGVVEQVLVRNEEPVEFGQPLFLVRPIVHE